MLSHQSRPALAAPDPPFGAGKLSVAMPLVIATDPVDLAAPTIRVLIGATCRAGVLAPA
jgi:hypothetical protein